MFKRAIHKACGGIAAMMLLCLACRPALAAGNAGCLGCHARPGIVATFTNGEQLDATVGAEALAVSVHSSFSCTGCHKGYETAPHTYARYSSLAKFRAAMSRQCVTCHGMGPETSIHSALHAQSGGAVLCADCHGAHTTVRPLHAGTSRGEAGYCMGCHARGLMLNFTDGTTREACVSLEQIEASAHGRLQCSDCHFGFSSEEHPRRRFRTERDYVLAASDVCKRCHYDKYAKTSESIHYDMIKKGNLRAPTCPDCHGAHNTPQVNHDRTEGARKCRKCHTAIYNMYAGSVHGEALFNDMNTDVPACMDCHTAHKIVNPLSAEYHECIPEVCGSCHGNAAIMKKYGLSTAVVTTYLNDFHGVTQAFYRKEREELGSVGRPIAVCTDCHGTHNIYGTSGVSMPILKENLLERCRKCHPGAGANFPDAWLSHYVPSLKSAPGVYIVNLAYRIFMPLMVLALLLQVFLHAWRYLVSR